MDTLPSRTYRSDSRRLKRLSLVGVAVILVAHMSMFAICVQAETIKWATAVLSSTGVDTPGGALSAPDNMWALFLGMPSQAVFGGFTDATTYDFTALSSMLDVELNGADFISFEYNGSPCPNPYESCIWTFDDGSNTIAVNYVYGVGSDDSALLAWGGIPRTTYCEFFGISGGYCGEDHCVGFLVFGFGGALDMSAQSFSVRIDAEGNPGYPGTFTSPDPDCLGMVDSAVAVDTETWGSIKALYR